MNFELNEEQQQLAGSLKRFLEKDYDFEARKKVIASATGCSEAVWKTFAELGLLGLAVSEAQGGFGSGASDLHSVMDALGQSLVVEPFLSTVTVARLIDRCGSDAQKTAMLPAVIEGRMKLALATEEAQSRFDLSHVAVTARRDGAGWVLDGSKISAIDAPVADRILVSARTSGKAGDADGVSLFLVDRNAAGLALKSFRTQDSARAADIALKGVKVGPDALVGAEGKGLPLLEEAVDFATVLLCSEAVGAMQYACDATLEYLKTRKQFGVPIGSFQALQHRMVDMIVSTEQARSITYLAGSKVDGGAADAAERRRVVSAAKVKISEAARHVGQEAVQMHGGMGITLEMKVAHSFKRLTMIGLAFGDADFHLERFAA
jgi:alkylation response protein AidB-like acyl-CoA dehydrogenase